MRECQVRGVNRRVRIGKGVGELDCFTCLSRCATVVAVRDRNRQSRADNDRRRRSCGACRGAACRIRQIRCRRAGREVGSTLRGHANGSVARCTYRHIGATDSQYLVRAIHYSRPRAAVALNGRGGACTKAGNVIGEPGTCDAHQRFRLVCDRQNHIELATIQHSAVVHTVQRVLRQRRERHRRTSVDSQCIGWPWRRQRRPAQRGGQIAGG
mmetsp:Transcript_28765/g.54549  ORF Transcript_28765/g.54549 Transcript_28765/m.54549 type:complete len:212 (+) Transcript_28765:6636-7271(+)